MKKTLPVILVVVAVAGVAALVQNDRGNERAVAATTLYTSSVVGSAAGDRSASAAGYVVFLDPETGEFTNGPQGAVHLNLDQDLQNALSTSSEGLTEVRTQGGGVYVDLQGRFQSTVFATVDADGELHTSCASTLPNGQSHEHGYSDHVHDASGSRDGGE